MAVEMNLAEEAHLDYTARAITNRLGLWLFLLSDSFLFLGLYIARMVLWGMERPELNQLLGLIVTSILLVSSFFMNRAETGFKFGDIKTFNRGIRITIVLGLIFLIGVVGVEWQIAPFGPSDGAFGAVFYMMTGMHALHVVSGVVFLLIVSRNVRRGVVTPQRYLPVEAAAVYWHFVDLVWIFFYPALYLIGQVP
ncbi:MAG TPA: cytochrome c oxidase subunit 3 [Anaerolineales bacterium]|nr:cytochrome c oxidase subunit 3 [Anaerolineales bacterium]